MGGGECVQSQPSVLDDPGRAEHAVRAALCCAAGWTMAAATRSCPTTPSPTSSTTACARCALGLLQMHGWTRRVLGVLWRCQLHQCSCVANSVALSAQNGPTLLLLPNLVAGAG